MLVQLTAGAPPPRLLPNARLMDVARLHETSGIQRLGNSVTLGISTAWPAIIRSTLLGPAAASLRDAAILMESMQPGGALLHALTRDQADNPILLALNTLAGRAQLAIRDQQGSIIHQTWPLHRALHEPPEQPHLLLAVQLTAPLQHAGSALYRESDLSPIRPDARAAAAAVHLAPKTGLLAEVRLSLTFPGQWPVACPAVAALVGESPKKEAIELAVRLARRNCLQAQATFPDYSLVLSPHLIRETLDRAMARAQALAS